VNTPLVPRESGAFLLTSSGGANMITLLGEHIDLVRPKRIAKPLTDGAWRKRRAGKFRTILLTCVEQQRIAKELGYKFVGSKEMI
jgi:hypothetical protein